MSTRNDLWQAKGIMSELLTPDQQVNCAELIAKLKELVKNAGTPVGELALAIFALEFQLENNL